MAPPGKQLITVASNPDFQQQKQTKRGFRFRIEGLGFRIEGLGLRAYGLGFRV